jgi:hypothetical protein
VVRATVGIDTCGCDEVPAEASTTNETATESTD